MVEVDLLSRYENMAKQFQHTESGERKGELSPSEPGQGNVLPEQLVMTEVRGPKVALATRAATVMQRNLTVVVSGVALSPTSEAMQKAGLDVEIALATELDPRMRAAINGKGPARVVDDGAPFHEA